MRLLEEQRAARPWLRFGLAFGVFTFLGLLEALDWFARHAYLGRPARGWETLASGLLLWYTWAILAWFLYRLTQRFPIEQHAWRRRLLLHSAACLVFVLIKLVADYPIVKAFLCPEPESLTFGKFYVMALTDRFYYYVLIYWAIVGVLHALDYYRKYRDRELMASQLEARLAHAQLQLLKMQLHPHFLFNTLNAISALIHKDTEVADRMVARLGDLLRLTLEHHGIQEVSLEEELEFIRVYLEIEQLRFGPRLDVQVDVDPDALSVRVPYLVLQPLVENAIRHGIAPQSEAGCVAVRAERVGRSLRLQVEDTGPGLAAASNGETRKIGLANTRARLEQLYGREHRFELGRGQLGGLLVTIEVPSADHPASSNAFLVSSRCADSGAETLTESE